MTAGRINAADALTISALTVTYGTIPALDRLDLTIKPNELFVLLGASGSGKTTLLSAIAGFVRPTSGQILLDGTDLSGLPPHRRPVNTMFQSYALFPHMSVAANIGFGLRQQGISRTETAQRVQAMLTLVRLEGFGRRRPTELSGGQQQRVALARSLAPSPRVLLLDEPLSALDQSLRRDTRTELVRLRRSLGISFVLVTHDQDEALEMADRIGVMRDGRMAQVGTPAELYESPADRFVAGFLGAANILPCMIDGTSVALPNLGITIRTARPGPTGPGLLALRAERLRIGGNPLPNRVDGTVTDSTYAGDALSVSVRLADGTVLRIKRALSDGLTAAAIEPGTTVRVSWQPEACMLLPP
ncbi:ABC transporter ATP-binding protein [Acidisphaera sp. S103]|uniref:ABC transporter ATP-binding protein n=1 Tax=Acidisphaera sp. S103 TaxID=1747223 RepID=UPI00131BF306|nr:ABC transporter ATP-binding protein [Acidisphaera sp. S103]